MEREREIYIYIRKMSEYGKRERGEKGVNPKAESKIARRQKAQQIY